MSDVTNEELQAKLATALESIKRLEGKNSELITREKAAKAIADEAEIAAAAAAEKAGDIEAIKANLKKMHDAEMKKLNDENSGLSKRLETLVIDNHISETIAQANVLPHLQRAARLMLRDGVEMRNGEAFVGDVPFADHTASWLASEEARSFVASPLNSGAGATGSTTSASNHGFTKENIKSREAEWMMLEKTNPALFKQIGAETGIKP